MMVADSQILIVGAGPSGLSMAIFLAEQGFEPRIIDKKKVISHHSKALAINPRTLEILEPFGITDRFLRNGRKMSAINMWKKDEHIIRNDFSTIKHRYPFMLVQPQKESEEILLDEVQKRNIKVEYGTALQSIDEINGKYEVVLVTQNGLTKNSNYKYIIGADGGGSNVRQSAGIEYVGFKYEDEWKLFDIELETSLTPEEGHIRIYREGGLILLPLYDNIWRVVSNIDSMLDLLPSKTKIGKVLWESDFHIHHKLASQLVKGNIVLIGDAAHQHSPVGARGMNLGIEDAFIASQMIVDGQLSRYTEVRMPYLKRTVSRINNITTGFAGNSKASRFVRSNFELFKFLFPLAMPRIQSFVLGLNK